MTLFGEKQPVGSSDVEQVLKGRFGFDVWMLFLDLSLVRVLKEAG